MRRRTSLALALFLESCAFTPPQPEVIAIADIGEKPVQAECEAAARSYWHDHTQRDSWNDIDAPTIAAIGPLERGWYRVSGGFRYAWSLPATCSTEEGSLRPVQFYFIGSNFVACASGNQHRVIAQFHGGGRTAVQAGIAAKPAPQPVVGPDGWTNTGQ